jgi:ketosteroid isomerase-like protein
MKKTIIVCFLVMGLVFPAVLMGGFQDSTLTKQDEISIRNLHNDFEKCILEPNWYTLIVKFYSEDAVQKPQDEPPVVGIKAIQTRFERLKGYSWQLRERPIESIGGRNGLAFVWSHYQQKGTRPDGTSFGGSGDFLQVLRKQQDGSWKIIYDTWSYDNK